MSRTETRPTRPALTLVTTSQVQEAAATELEVRATFLSLALATYGQEQPTAARDACLALAAACAEHAVQTEVIAEIRKGPMPWEIPPAQPFADAMLGLRPAEGLPAQDWLKPLLRAIVRIESRHAATGDHVAEATARAVTYVLTHCP